MALLVARLATLSFVAEIDFALAHSRQNATAQRSASRNPVKGLAEKTRHESNKSDRLEVPRETRPPRPWGAPAARRRGGSSGTPQRVPPAPTPPGKATTSIAGAPRGRDSRLAVH
jgi:hypothetical protein